MPISRKDIEDEAGKIIEKFEPVKHNEVLNQLLKQVEPFDFRGKAKIKNANEQVKRKHYLVLCIDEILSIAKRNKWGICLNNEFIYVYNGAYWSCLNKYELQTFLGRAAEKMGIDKFDARLYAFREQLYKQFLAVAYMPKPEQKKDSVLINLKNGTFEITPKKQNLRRPEPKDFIIYQLPFEYSPEAKAPVFQSYLDTVQPDKNLQNILAEYLAYVFISPSTLKLEKTLLLYGTGANGKSVFFDIVNALLGSENVSSYSLKSLTDESGYYRAMIANKLVNYASEINGNLETSTFKALVSGEPVEARLIYGSPFTLNNYAKLIFNCNDLPKDVEQSNAYFRRFLIIPFSITIPDSAQDKQLAQKIIAKELSGVFNWVLEGLKRLLTQKNFTYSEIVDKQLEQYKKQSDSVQIFLDEAEYKIHPNEYLQLKELYLEYRIYCSDDGYKPVNKSNFIKRLEGKNIIIEKKNIGNVAFISKDK
jgi:putative DNA primase/helicase